MLTGLLSLIALLWSVTTFGHVVTFASEEHLMQVVRRSRRVAGTVALVMAVLVLVVSAPAGADTTQTGMARIDAVELDASERYPYASVIDPDGRYAYLGLFTNPARVAKIDLRTFARVDGIQLDGGISVVWALMAPDGRHAYFLTNNSRLIAVDLATFQQTATLELSATWGGVIAPDGAHAYFPTGRGVAKVDLASMQQVDSIDLSVFVGASATIDPDGAYAYFTSRDAPTGSPAAVVKVDLGTFTEVDVLRFAPEAGAPQAGSTRRVLMEPGGERAHFIQAGMGGYGDWLMTIDLGTFTWTHTLELDLWNIGSAVIAPDGATAYVGAMDLPGRIAQVDLEAFENVDVLTLDGTERSFRSAVIAPDGEHAYFASATGHRLVKVGLNEVLGGPGDPIEPGDPAEPEDPSDPGDDDEDQIDLDGVPNRIAGADRFETAADICAEFVAPNPDTVFVATGLDFPDALTGGVPAALSGTCMLLATGDLLPAPTISQLQRLDAGSITVLGGPAAIDDSVLTQLEGFTDGPVRRLAGVDRFDTAAAISRDRFEPATTRTAFVATGLNFPDALAGVPPAAAYEAPILLTATEAIPTPTLEELARLDLAEIIVLGGPGAVSPAVEAQLGSLAPDVLRVAGEDRFATSVAVGDLLIGQDPPQPLVTFVATGIDFPDALAGGAVAGAVPGPTYLAAQDVAPPEVVAELQRSRPDRLIVFGGQSAISSATEQTLRQAAGFAAHRRMQQGR